MTKNLIKIFIISFSFISTVSNAVVPVLSPEAASELKNKFSNTQRNISHVTIHTGASA